MTDTHTLTLFASHCRSLAVGAATLAGEDHYLDMALQFECEAEAIAGLSDEIDPRLRKAG